MGKIRDINRKQNIKNPKREKLTILFFREERISAEENGDKQKLKKRRDKKRVKELKNKAGYTATEVACGWAGAIFEVTRPFGQEQ